MDTSLEIIAKARIFFYFREKYYNLMLSTCKECISKFKGNMTYHLFHSLALVLNNRFEEGIHALDSIRSQDDMKLSVAIALLYANKSLGINNSDLYTTLENEVREYRKSCDVSDFYLSAFVLCVFNKYEKGLDYADKALVLQSDFNDCLSLKGWILLHLYKGDSSKLNSASEVLQKVSRDGKHLDGILGLTECYKYQNEVEEAINIANKAVVKFASTNLPLIFKMRVLFSMKNWEQLNEIINRIFNTDPNNLEAIKMNVIVLLTNESNYEEGVLCVKKFMQELHVIEPGNSVLLLYCCKLFSRICGRNESILAETLNGLESIVKTDSNNVEFIYELAYQNLLQNKIKEALRYFKMACKLNDNFTPAVIGGTYCELLQNNLQQVQQQMTLLGNNESVKNDLTYLLISSKLAGSKNEAISFLDKCSYIILDKIKNFPFSERFLNLLDPDFVITLSKEYFNTISNEPDIIKTSKITNTNNLLNILQTLTKICPGLYEAKFLLSKVQFLRGDTGSSINNLNEIISKCPDNSDAYLLMAQINLQNGLYDRASQNLEAALSSNFKIRENPIYHFNDGVVNKNIKNYPDAIKSFKTALSLININQNKTKERPEFITVSLAEKAQIYIELLDSYNLIGNTEESMKLLEDATAELKGTSEESRILILTADQYIKRNNIQDAIDILQNVNENESYYLQAKAKLAEIFLENRKDKYAYLECYKEMVEKEPSAESYVMLGDACMKILEPDEALECYNKALEQNPRDPYLTSKMGRALVETHWFKRAINFYKETIKVTNNPDLKLQLAELYFQLKEYGKAELLLVNELEIERNEDLDDIVYLRFKTQLLQLLASIQEKSGKSTSALSTLKDAKDNQNRLYKRLRLENSVSEDDKKLLVQIGIKSAELAILLKDLDQAMQHYKETLEVVPNDINVLCALAKLYIQMNYLELCQKTCSNILKLDPENETASVMMADIAFHKVDFDMASFHFTQLLTKQPTNWNALSRLVEIMRRLGTLEEAQEYLKNAEHKSLNSTKEAGLNYCTALYQWYLGNLNGALRNFNLARQDPEWGQLSIYNMIEICLNPNDEMFADDILDNDDAEYRDSRTMALKTADRLLKELKQKLDNNGDEVLRYNLLVNFRLLATKEKFNIERALEEFISLTSRPAYKDHIGVVLGIANAHNLLKQQQRAKNQLKRIVKTTWTFEDAEYLERCWLLLADSYIQSAKYESAIDLLNKVLQYNKSCSKAYEYLGFISEKEQQYKSAAGYYENAWNYGGKASAGVGYKLAFSYMKIKRFASAIDVGQQVLKLNPDYPRIKKDILDKSINNLRT